MTTRDPQAIWTPSPNFWPSRMGYAPKWLILHSTAGGGAVNWLTNPASQVSAHYVIAQDGTITQLVDEEAAAWANGPLSDGHDSWWSTAVNPNLVTISIEHEKPDTTNTIPITAAQALASFQLVSRICKRWNIPARKADASGGITGHYSIDPVYRSHCPGTYPFDGLFAYLAQTHGDDLRMLSLTDPMGQHFVDAGNNRWHSKTSNVDLAYSHLDFYRKYEGIFGVPLTNEIHLAQIAGTAIVVYERAIAIYDPLINGKRRYDNPPGAGDVYLMHIDSGIGQQIVAKPLLVELQKQVEELKAEIASKPQEAELQALHTKLVAYQTAFSKVSSLITTTEKDAA